MQRIRVLLVFGGQSAEHEVSIASARNVYAAMDDTKYDIKLAYITKAGRWHLVDDIELLEDAHKVLLPVLGSKHFVVEPGGLLVTPEVMLPILHGPNGEDGSVQGLAQLLNIPIVGCGIVGSAVCMDKDVAKRLLSQAGLPVADCVVYRVGDPTPEFSRLTLQLGNPLFVKPANMGSSVGVSKVHTEQEFADAMAQALKHDAKVLIEQAVVGRELECSVLGNEAPEASAVVGEVKAPDHFYSYDEKYSAESHTGLEIPAEITDEETQKIRGIALKAYRALECRGLARVDVFLTESGDVFINEINTLPGFTNISMYPKLWRASGLGYAQLIDKLVGLALAQK